MNAAIEDGKSDQLGIVVMDELHMLDDENRGYLIELTITKLLCLQQGIQLIGMSATLSSPRLIADWLGAKFYVSECRPVPIDEHLVYENVIPRCKCKAILPNCESAQLQLLYPETSGCSRHNREISAS